MIMKPRVALLTTTDMLNSFVDLAREDDSFELYELRFPDASELESRLSENDGKFDLILAPLGIEEVLPIAKKHSKKVVGYGMPVKTLGYDYVIDCTKIKEDFPLKFLEEVKKYL